MPIFMKLEGIEGSVRDVHAAQADSFVFAKATPVQDDVVVDGRIITAENPAAASGEARPMESLSLNFTEVEFEPAQAHATGGVMVALGDGSVRMTHGDFDVI